jgi:Na+/H+ antiporter NhaC
LDNFGLAALVPFIIGIFFLIWKDDVIFPLIGGLFLGSILLSKFNPFLGFLNITGVLVVDALTNNLNIFIIFMIVEVLLLFSLLSRGGFIYTFRKLLSKKNFTKNRLEYIISASNCALFIDRHFSALLSGVFTKPFANQKKLSPEKHSYLVNTISSSLSTIIPFTTLTPIIILSIGAAFTSLGISYSPIKAFYKSLPYQYFNIFALFIVLSTLLLKKDILLMAKFDLSGGGTSNSSNTNTTISFGLNVNVKKQQNFRTMLYGMAGTFSLIFGIIIGGFILKRHGYNKLIILNILNHHLIFISALFTGIIFIILYSMFSKIETYSQFREKKGGIAYPLLLTLFYIILSMSLESLAEKLGFSASLIGSLHRGATLSSTIPMIFFLFSSLISFLSGSTLFTVTTVTPLAIRLISMSMTDPLIVNNLLFATIGSVLSGATFGDINSPYSLTFIISAATAETSVSRHFKSQISYSLVSFVITVIFGYLLILLGIKPYLSISSGLLVIAGVFFLSTNGIQVIKKIKKLI